MSAEIFKLNLEEPRVERRSISRSPLRARGPAALVALVAALVYYNSLFGEFTNWDDPMLVVENEAIRGLSLAQIGHLFSHPVNGTYLPLRALSYAVDYRLWGLSPAGYHLGNIALHAATSALAYLVALRLGGSQLGAIVAGLVFAAHPVHTEGAAWISGRKEVLCGLFFFACFLAYMRLVAQGSWRGYVATLALMALAGLSKGTAITLPLVFVLYDFCFRTPVARSGWRAQAAHYVPFFALDAVLFAVHLTVGRSAGVVQHYHGGSMASNLLTMLKALLSYLRLLLLPIHQCARYHYPPVRPALSGEVVGLLLIGGVLLALGVWLLKRRGLPSFAVWWFALNLLPVSNIVPISVPLAERYLYVPLFGLSLLAGMAWTVSRTRYATAMLAIVVFWSGWTQTRNWVWADSTALWTDTVKTYPMCVDALGNLAATMFKQERYRGAAPLLEMARAQEPDKADIRASLGKVYRKLGQPEKAAEELERAIALEPDKADSYVALGLVRKEAGQLQAARALYEKALALTPDHVEALNNLGVALEALGELEKAEAQYRRCVEVAPEHASAHYNLGRLYATLNRLEEAMACLRRATRLRPSYAEAHHELGNTCIAMGRKKEALEALKRATELAPSLWQAQLLLGLDALDRRDAQEAVRRLKLVLAVNPSEPTALEQMRKLSSPTKR